jgi:hypothetical protein
VLGESVSGVEPQTLDQDNTTLTITSDGNTERKISLGSSNGWLFFVGDYVSSPRSAKLVIDGHVTLEGRSDNNTALVAVATASTLELKGNAKLTGNTGQSGGGIYAESIYPANRTTISMSGNAEISGNTAITPFTTGGGGGGTSGGGGGVFLLWYVDFTMSENAVIKNNTAVGNGGGIFIGNNDCVVMNGGEITGNTSTGTLIGNGGGGVYVATNGTFSVKSEQVKAGIRGNTAALSANGPQVYVGSGTFTVGGVAAGSF